MKSKLKPFFKMSLIFGQQSFMSDSDPLKSVGPANGAPECRSPSTPRMELLSPSKVKDRSQNVTEKVTQVWGSKTSRWLSLW